MLEMEKQHTQHLKLWNQMLGKSVERGDLLVRLSPQWNPRVTSIHNSSFPYKINIFFQRLLKDPVKLLANFNALLYQNQ